MNENFPLRPFIPCKPVSTTTLTELSGGSPTVGWVECQALAALKRARKTWPPIVATSVADYKGPLERFTGWVYLDGGLLECDYGCHYRFARNDLGVDDPDARGWIHVQRGLFGSIDVKPSRAQVDTLAAICLATGESIVELLKEWA